MLRPLFFERFNSHTIFLSANKRQVTIKVSMKNCPFSIGHNGLALGGGGGFDARHCLPEQK
jgi:hypothetical protein